MYMDTGQNNNQDQNYEMSRTTLYISTTHRVEIVEVIVRMFIERSNVSSFLVPVPE